MASCLTSLWNASVDQYQSRCIGKQLVARVGLDGWERLALRVFVQSISRESGGEEWHPQINLHHEIAYCIVRGLGGDFGMQR